MQFSRHVMACHGMSSRRSPEVAWGRQPIGRPPTPKWALLHLALYLDLRNLRRSKKTTVRKAVKRVKHVKRKIM
jgi:hypothetical protein